MAIYSTFFVSNPDELLAGFAGWQLPLPQPVRREILNAFTKKTSIVETREPEWPDDPPYPPPGRTYIAKEIKGRYEDYLESRLPAFVQIKPHWCAKGLTDLEVNPLGIAAGLDSALEIALYNRPSIAKQLFRLRPDLVSALVAADSNARESIASNWAAAMSLPYHTHSVTGRRLRPDWAASFALDLLNKIVAVAKQGSGDSSTYLLLEA